MSSGEPPWHAWFGDEQVAVKPLGNTGFSGSRVLLVERVSGDRFVAKHFAAHVPRERIASTHALMRHLRECGIDTVPKVVAVCSEAVASGGVDSPTLATDPTGARWELVAFMPGRPRSAPSLAEAETALTGLARLHAAAAKMPGAGVRIEPSPGVTRRVAQAARIVAEPWRTLDPRSSRVAGDSIGRRLAEAVEIFETGGGRDAVGRISGVIPPPVATLLVLRDVWSDHVLFADDGRLSGFVDFHAAGRDTPATDLARLLGSWDAPPTSAAAAFALRWHAALAAYDAVRPLSAAERRSIPWLHATGVICGLDNWWRWLVLERRSFDDIDRVLTRIDRLIRQLPEALDIARTLPLGRD